jgi:hypothetical protein
VWEVSPSAFLPAWARRRSPAALLLAAALVLVYGIIEALNYGRGASIGMQRATR